MKPIILKTYAKFWAIETVLYHMEGIRLPTPMSARNAGYYFFGVVIVAIISRIPILNLIQKLPVLNQPLIFYLGIPFGLMKLLSAIKIEGKHPYQFLRDIIRFTVFTPRHYEYLRPLKVAGGYRFKKSVPRRMVVVKSVFEEKTKDVQFEITY